MKTIITLLTALLLFSCSPPEQPDIKEKRITLTQTPFNLIPLGFHGSFESLSLPQAQNTVITPYSVSLHLEGNQFGMHNVYNFNFNNSHIHVTPVIITITKKEFVVVISKINNSPNLYVTIKKPDYSIDLETFIKQ